MSLRTALALTAALALAACGGADDGTAQPPSASPGSPAAQGSEAPAVDVGSGPVGIAAAPDGAVWVVSPGTGTLSRIPAGAEETDLQVDVGGVPLRVVAAYGAVWVSSFDAGRLVRVDPQGGRVTQRIRTGAEPEGVAAGDGSVWVVTQGAGDLVRIDPADGSVVSRTDIGPGARLVSVGARAVHVAHYEDDSIVDVDPRTGRVVRQREVCDGPQGMAEAGGMLWVTCTLDEQLAGLDLGTLEVQERVDVAGQPDSVVVAPDGSLLVVAEGGPALVRVDPATAGVVARVELAGELPLYDDANLDVAIADDQVWVTSYAADQVHHVAIDDVPTGGS